MLWAPELHASNRRDMRDITGEGNLLAQSAENAGNAEACFEHALDISRSQEAKSLELRAAMNLARLWQQQGKGDDARERLRDCYA